MINVSRPYLPNRKRLLNYIDQTYEGYRLTNHGPLVRELTGRLEDYLGVDNLLLVSNGTLALQVAYKVLGLDQGSANPEAITTPFSFIATSSSLKWQGIQPVFCDIEPAGWCLDPAKLEAAITPETRGIVPVHVFGNGCDVEAIDRCAQRHDLRVIYDGAHAFGIRYGSESLLRQGDATTLSFHATKLFHTVEGGAIVFREKKDKEIAQSMINFGIDGDGEIAALGINAKMSEFHAAMGLCVLEDIEFILEERQAIAETYRQHLPDVVAFQAINPDCSENHAYFPILLDNERRLLSVKQALKEMGCLARRYFYPSLDTLDVLCASEEQTVSRNIASRVLCLPIYPGLKKADVLKICNTITSTVVDDSIT